MADTEALLDRFPVSEEELTRLLTLFPHHELFDAKEPVESLTSLFTTNTSGEQPDTQLLVLERELLPEIPRIFQKALHSVFVLSIPGEENDPSLAKKGELLEAAVSLMGRRNERFPVQTIYDAVADTDERASSEQLVSLVYRMITALSVLENGSIDTKANKNIAVPKSWIHSLSKESPISRATWNEWVNRMAPNLYQVVATLFHYVFFGPNAPVVRTKPFQLLQFDLPSNLLSPSLQAQLALQGLGRTWRRLYSSEQDGISFRTFQASLIGFVGPTVILLQTVHGECFGYYTELPWKTSPKWYGNETEAFLFSLKPRWNVYFPTGGSFKHMQYLHLPLSSRSQSSLAGLCVGGVAEDAPRLYITKSLENCVACCIDTVFESGPLLKDESNSFFDVDMLEVWAVNTTAENYQRSLESGQLQLEIKEETRKQMSRVDKKQFVEDFASGAFLNDLYNHREQARGRAEFVAADDERLGYYVDGKAPSVRSLSPSQSPKARSHRSRTTEDAD